MSSTRKLLITCIAAMLAVFASAFVSAGPAQAATCKHPTFKFFPGSPTSKLRYAEVNFSFDVCSNTAPMSWGASVSKARTNSTGKNLGFFLDGTTIRTTSSNSSYRYMQGVISGSSCLARVGWPCYRSYTFHVRFQLSRTGVKAYDIRVPGGMALFRTP